MKKWNKEQEEKLQLLLESKHTYKEIAELMGRSYKAIKVRAYKLQLAYDPEQTIFKEAVGCLVCGKIVVDLITAKRKFCSSSCGAKYNNAKRRVIFKCLSCGKEKNRSSGAKKYCSKSCESDFKLLQKRINVKSGKASARAVKSYLLDKFGRVCFDCGNTTWLNKPIPIELEHIDGNHKNNNLENVKLLCPNCHALTPTYKGKNKGRGRHSRRVRYHEGKSY